MPIDLHDCQEKAKDVGIYDKDVWEKIKENLVCGCRIYNYKGKKHVHWNDPKHPACSPVKKCDNEEQMCICVSKGITYLFQIF